MKSRKELLQNLLTCADPEATNFLRNSLGHYPWDWDEGEPLITVNPKDVIRILERFLKGEMSARQVESWADALDMREDVDMEDTLRVMTELANPVSSLTSKMAKAFITQLQLEQP